MSVLTACAVRLLLYSQQGGISIITTLTFHHLPPFPAPISNLQLPL